MAVNDLMMKIQLLVESGKSTAELNRLQKGLERLTSQISELDRTRLKPLTQDLDLIKRAAANLRTVNLKNFATSIDEVKKAFTGLGLGTANLDRLRSAYQQLNAQLASNNLSNYQAQLKTLNDRLREAKQLTLTASGQSFNANLASQLTDLKTYNRMIQNADASARTHRQTILDLKKQLSQLPNIKFDASLLAGLEKLNPRRGLKNQAFSIADPQSIANLQDYNALLKKNESLFDVAKSKVVTYQQTLANLRLEAQRLKAIDLTNVNVGGNTRNLLGELSKSQAKIADLRTKELVPLQNLVRNIQANANFNKAFNIDPLKANLKVARAELAKLLFDTSNTRKAGGIVDVNDIARIAQLETKIVNDNKTIADLELKAQQTSARNLAVQQRRLATKQNQLALDQEELKNIKTLIAAQKQLAQQAAQSVNTKKGGIFDTQASQLAAKKEAALYKNNIETLKQYLNERKAAAQEEANLIKNRITGVQQQLAQGQLTRSQWVSERAEIKANIQTEKERSRIYQQTLNEQIRGIKSSITSEQEREKGIRSQIRELTKLNTVEAQRKRIALENELVQAGGRKADLKTQITETQNAARAELQRIRALDESANSMRRQGQQVTTLSRLFKGASGPANEFMAAFKFMLGPQMLGFAAAGKIISFADSFVQINKQIENLIRGLNAISGGAGVSEFNALVNVSNRLGVSIGEAAHSFLQLEASAQGTGLEGQKVKKIFESFANALNITGADSVTMNRAFRSISQMISKGQLYAEELKGQLAEALPGAIQVFARALSVTPKQLMNLVKSGQIEGQALERTLILVADELRKTYKVANESDFTFTQKAALAKNAFMELNVAIGNTGLWKSLGNSILSVRDIIVSITSNVDSLSNTIKYEFGLISKLFADDITSIFNEFSKLKPNIDWSALKNELFLIPQTLRIGITNSISGIKQFFIDVETIIKNFHEKQKTQPGVTLFEPVENVNPQDFVDEWTAAAANAVKFKETWEIIKSWFNEPIEIKAEIKPLNFEEFRKTLDQALLSYSIDVGINYDKAEYALYLRNIESANAEIRKQNTIINEQNINIQRNIEASEQQKKAIQDVANTQNNAAKSITDEERKRLELNNIISKASKLEQQRIGFHRAYIDQLESGEESAKQKSLALSKEEVKSQKELLNLRQAYNDAILEVNASKYKKWAEQGQITQEGADFLIQSQKAELLRKSWDTAQDYVQKYNDELKRVNGLGANVSKTDEDRLKLLKEQADDQLKYSEAKATQAQNEYKINQIFEARKGLAESFKQTQLDINRILEEAEKQRNGQQVAQQTITPEVDTETKAKPKIEEFVTWTNGQKPVIPTNAETQSAFDSVKGFINWANSQSISIPVNASISSGTTPDDKKRWGGYISGYGGGDRIRALLEPGEFVLRKEAVRALGIEQLSRLNRLGSQAKSSLLNNLSIPRFASGGSVSGQPIIINVPGAKPIYLSGSRDAAAQLVNVLTRTGRAL